MELKDLAGRHTLTFVPKLDVHHPIDPSASGVMFGLGDMIYLVFEDPSDGYRSNAGPLLSFKGSPYELGGEGWSPDYLRGQEVDCVHMTEDDASDYGSSYAQDFLSIRSALTGKELLRVGTTNVDDYYPSFIVQWYPDNLDVNRPR